MLSWSTKRRLIYGGSVVLVIALVLFAVFWSLFYRAPTCSDGTQNGDETGIDCGGSCSALCTSDALEPAVLWARVFSISGDIYSAVAYVENPNVNSKNDRATYQFRIFDSNNNLITVRDGETSIPKGKKFAVFETGFVLKNSKPKSADFRFVNFSKWTKDLTKDPEISIVHSTFLSTSTAPRITGVVSNKSLIDIGSLELVVFVMDNHENVIGASKTFVDNLTKNSSQDFVFTWQKPFESEVSVINVIYRKL